MIEVRDVKYEAELFAEVREEETQRGGVGAAGDGENEWTGAQDGMGARV